MNWIDSVSTTLLNKDLDGLWTRQQAISDNLANFETPGYKAKSVSFENQLREQLSSQNGTAGETMRNIESVQPVRSVASDEQFRTDGNGVDLEKENLELIRTTMNYYYSLQEISDSFGRIQTAINGGK